MDQLIKWLEAHYTRDENINHTQTIEIAKDGVFDYNLSYPYLCIVFNEYGIVTTLTMGESDIKVWHILYKEPIMYNNDGEVSNDTIINAEDYHFDELNDAIRVFNKLANQAIPMI